MVVINGAKPNNEILKSFSTFVINDINTSAMCTFIHRITGILLQSYRCTCCYKCDMNITNFITSQAFIM